MKALFVILLLAACGIAACGGSANPTPPILDTPIHITLPDGGDGGWLL
jgi:hypothetical protein